MLRFIQTKKTALEKQEMLKTAFDRNTRGTTDTSEWFPPFKYWETLAEDCRHSGHPSTLHTDENVEKVYKILNRNQESTISMSVRSHLSYVTHQ
jgi:hypothetical protein